MQQKELRSVDVNVPNKQTYKLPTKKQSLRVLTRMPDGELKLGSAVYILWNFGFSIKISYFTL